MKKERIILALAILLSCQNLNANAQLPGSVDAGAINNYTFENQKLNSVAEKIKTKKAEPNVDTSNLKSSINKNSVKKLEFVLNDVKFSGNTVISTKELNEFITPLIGQTVDYPQLVELTQKMTEYYHLKGYISSLVYLPPQNIVGGSLKINVLEGRVGHINVKGNKWAKPFYFKEVVFKPNDIAEGQIFNVNSLKSSMTELNENTYLKGKIYLNSGKEPGTTDLSLEAKDRLPLGLNISWDNQGRDLVGVQRANIGITDYNVCGIGDRFDTMVSLAKGTTGVGTNYSVPINKYGTQLQLGYSMSDVSLGGIYKAIKMKGLSNFYQAGLMQPLYKSERYEVTTDMGFDIRTTKTTYGEGDILDRYSTKVLRNGLNLVANDAYGRWISRLQTSVGLGVSSASSSIPDSNFFKFNGNIARVQYLPKKFIGIARGSVQVANKTLYGSEEMQIGGAYTVRGFEDGILFGDNGFTASFEVRHVIPYLKDVRVPYWRDKTFKIPFKDNVHFATFYDAGLVALTHQHETITYQNFLQSVGVGLRFYLTKYLSANIDLGIPLGRQRYSDQKPVRVHFSLSSAIY